MDDSKKILSASLRDEEYGFTLTLTRRDDQPWDQIAVTYNSAAEIVSVSINGETRWEHPVKGPAGITPHMLD